MDKRLRYQGHSHKVLWQWVLYTLGFEGGLLTVALPVMSWWLGIGLLEALVLDLGFVLFYLVYAFVYNWSYGRVFPIPDQPAQRLMGQCEGGIKRGTIMRLA